MVNWKRLKTKPWRPTIEFYWDKYDSHFVCFGITISRAFMGKSYWYETYITLELGKYYLSVLIKTWW